MRYTVHNVHVHIYCQTEFLRCVQFFVHSIFYNNQCGNASIYTSLKTYPYTTQVGSHVVIHLTPLGCVQNCIQIGRFGNVGLKRNN